MATATLTNAVKALLTEVEGRGFQVDSLPSGKDAKEIYKSNALVRLKVVEVDGVHRYS
jgi:hypothetical protein